MAPFAMLQSTKFVQKGSSTTLRGVTMEKRIALPPLPVVLPEKSRKGEKRLYVLGADDPEMEEITRLLTALGREYVFATAGGKRVNAETAYCCDPVSCKDGVTLTFVECEAKEYLPGAYFLDVVDHHPRKNSEESRGFNLPPSQYLLGSSLGQVSVLEDVILTEYQMTIAALDHCPGQAMRGLCPGIDPDRAKLIYHAETARRRNVTIEAVYASIQEVGKDMAIAPSTMVGKDYVVDMTKVPTGMGYSLRYISTIGAAINLGIPVLLSNKNGEHDPEKRVLTGIVTPELVTGFRTDYAPRYHLQNLWGDNNRGAGGIVPQ
jgi:hypothetical protein